MQWFVRFKFFLELFLFCVYTTYNLTHSSMTLSYNLDFLPTIFLTKIPAGTIAFLSKLVTRTCAAMYFFNAVNTTDRISAHHHCMWLETEIAETEV